MSIMQFSIHFYYATPLKESIDAIKSHTISVPRKISHLVLENPRVSSKNLTESSDFLLDFPHFDGLQPKKIQVPRLSAVFNI